MFHLDYKIKKLFEVNMKWRKKNVFQKFKEIIEIIGLEMYPRHILVHIHLILHSMQLF